MLLKQKHFIQSVRQNKDNINYAIKTKTFYSICSVSCDCEPLVMTLKSARA